MSNTNSRHDIFSATTMADYKMIAKTMTLPYFVVKPVIDIGPFTWGRQLRKPESHYSGNETALMMHYDWALNFHR